MEEPFFNESDERRLILTVENRALYVSKELLAAFSPVFKRMLYGYFKEAKANKIELKEKKVEDVLELLRAICPLPDRARKPVSYENFALLMSFADEFDIKDLRHSGEEFLEKQLLGSPVGDKAVFKVAVLASQFWNGKILRMCVPYLCTFTRNVFDEFKFLMSEKLVAAVYEAKLNRSFLYRHNYTIHGGCFCCGTDTVCENCQYCPEHVLKECSLVHDFSGCPVIRFGADTKHCLCGYEFDETWLPD